MGRRGEEEGQWGGGGIPVNVHERGRRGGGEGEGSRGTRLELSNHGGSCKPVCASITRKTRLLFTYLPRQTSESRYEYVNCCFLYLYASCPDLGVV